MQRHQKQLNKIIFDFINAQRTQRVICWISHLHEKFIRMAFVFLNHRQLLDRLYNEYSPIASTQNFLLPFIRNSFAAIMFSF